MEMGIPRFPMLSLRMARFYRDSDLKRPGALPVEETLALSLQGVAYVSSRVLLCLILS